MIYQLEYNGIYIGHVENVDNISNEKMKSLLTLGLIHYFSSGHFNYNLKDFIDYIYDEAKVIIQEVDVEFIEGMS